ncbi:deoxyribose-phosphate aldolase [Treponema sp. C6A8]|uniref:deoxyribose-phosphate aldolase n=1 Tax=Treponema sp. C6A8 TaxID=1410609 RepID=UPI0004864F0F|nr:deoxyribose-phosphate aldolase [Treponema sp. C6A8]
MTKQEIASYIDHTLLAPQAGVSEIEKLCKEAADYKFASVCVNPSYVKLSAELLKNSSVKVCTVVGFPLGATPSCVKAFEARTCIQDGADEVDMVINVGAAKDGRFTEVGKDIAAVVDASKDEGKKLGKDICVKVILETCYLSDEAIVSCCQCAKKAGADFVKTSTGFAIIKDKEGKLLPNGATAAHIALMRKTVGNDMGVKASGGVRTAEAAQEMIKAGASRIGTSSGAAIVKAFED